MRSFEKIALLAISLALVACGGVAPRIASSSHAITDDDTPPADRWAAIAYGVEWIDQANHVGNNYFGRAVSEPTELQADDSAIGACGYESCEIKVYVNVGCIGVAHGFDANNVEWYGFGAARYARKRGESVADGKRATRSLAAETAIEGCGGGTLNQFCTTQEAYCTWDNQPSSADAINAWVASMGGEQNPRVYNTLLYFSRATEGLLRNAGLSYDQARCVASGTWGRVAQVAISCQLAVDELDTVYNKANGIGS